MSDPSDQTIGKAKIPRDVPDTLAAPPSEDPDATVVGADLGAGAIVVPGMTLGDFKLLEVLGSGSFATVYRARQISLDREVALKVAANQNTEARTLASLEHEHVVRVHSETVDAERGLRLLCMKFVPGTDLQHVIDALAKRSPTEWSGRILVDVVDQIARHEPMFDVKALRDRKQLEKDDFIEAVCWMGARIAEALAHAHRNGVLHRDVKPANILIDRYGRPMLSDFNLALETEQGWGREQFGGTIRYMAPEHLDAFNPATGVSADAVDHRSDTCALGIVLFELFTGEYPYEKVEQSEDWSKYLSDLALQRRNRMPSLRRVRPEFPIPLDSVMRRCLDPEPGNRHSSAEELAGALEGCRELRRVERAMPPPFALTRFAEKFPTFALLLFVFLPHVIAEIGQVVYNSFAILPGLSDVQRQTFYGLTLGYSALVYGGLLWVGYRIIAPVFRCLHKLEVADPVTEAEVVDARRQALAIPRWALGLSLLGWLPGGALFPLGIHWLSDPVPGKIWLQFVLSFSIAGIVATTYAYFAVEAYVVRLLYPRLWVDPRDPIEQARKELSPINQRLRLFQFTAALIPLCGAILMMSVGTVEQFTLPFRLFVVGLITLGMVGFGGALLISSRINRTLQVLRGTTV